MKHVAVSKVLHDGFYPLTRIVVTPGVKESASIMSQMSQNLNDVVCAACQSINYTSAVFAGLQ